MNSIAHFNSRQRLQSTFPSMFFIHLQLDSWSVILNGHVEVSRMDCSVDQLHLGDSFGVKPVMDAQYHHGVMRTTVDDCQFVCIAQEHFFRILTQGMYPR